MGTANNCNVPENLLYWVEQHVWVRPEDDGTVTVGMTDAAQHLAGPVVTASPKGVGRKVKKGKSTGTVESSKWVGPIRSPIDGEIVASNQDIVTNPRILNEDPYGAGWFIRVKPDNFEADGASLVTGAEAIEKYTAFLIQEGINCAAA